MKIKRFLDKDMRRVLRRVREDQGPDAVILSNRRVDDGIEVITAIDYDESLIRQSLGIAKGTSNVIDSDVLARIAEDDPVNTDKRPLSECRAQGPDIVASDLELRPIETDDDELVPERPALESDELSLQGLRNEMSCMRALLETQLSGLVWEDTSKRFPLRAQVLRNLARLGLTPDVANIVVNRLEPLDDIRHLWRTPLTALAKLIPTVSDELLQRGGVVALIGPTGVGKTTTIAKIAARYSMIHGADEVALVCADAYRIGAKEHLMAFANIIGLKVHSASNSDELRDILDRLKNKKLVLVDTEGRSQRDRLLSSRLAAYGNHADRIRFYLTLSAASQEAGLDETVRQFKQVPLAGCIVTKIDEAGQLGCVISTLIRHDIPAAWFSDGQRIPDDLHAAEYKRLWIVNQAVQCMESSEPRIDERTMAENFSLASKAYA